MEVGRGSGRVLVLPFLVVDVTFLSANLFKIVEGGWFPLVLGSPVWW